MTGEMPHLVVPDQAVLAVQVVLVQRNPVGDESHGARPRVREDQGRVLVDLCLLRGRCVVRDRPAGVVGEGNVRLCRPDRLIESSEVVLSVCQSIVCHSRPVHVVGLIECKQLSCCPILVGGKLCISRGRVMLRDLHPVIR